jgi:hypothetical protein
VLFTRFLFVLMSLALTASAWAQDGTLAEAAFDKLRARPAMCPDHFEFIVAGDTRSSEPVTLPDEFYQMIREWNLLDPAFVVLTGDLILGGSAEGLGPQWDEFEKAVAECEAPVFPVAGNHDVSDAAAEAIYEERIGPLTYAFSYGDARFIILNTEEPGQVKGLSESQLDWLEKDLAATRLDNIFLFMHKPYFAGEWGESWRPAADLIKDRPVKAVFGSHDHVYCYEGEREGVHYIVSGGGGAERRVPESEGGFVHYLYVRVRGDEVDWTVIKPGAILPHDVVNREEVDRIRMLEDAISTTPVQAPAGEGFEGMVTVTIENPLESVISSRLLWHTPPGWEVTPSDMTYRVQPGAVTQLPFSVRAASSGAVAFPAPEYSTAITFPDAERAVTVREMLNLVPISTAVWAAQPVEVDGDLSEWQEAEKLPLRYSYGYDIRDEHDLSAEARFMWDAGHLYCAVEVRDDEFHQPWAGDIVWSADNIQLFIDAWEWGLTLTERGEEVFLYKGPGREGETVNTAVQLAVRQVGPRTVYEAAFPAEEVQPLRLHTGNSFRVSVVVNDLDPAVPGRERHWAELTPGWGDKGTGPTMKVVLGPEKPFSPPAAESAPRVTPATSPEPAPQPDPVPQPEPAPQPAPEPAPGPEPEPAPQPAPEAPAASPAAELSAP